MTCAFMSKLGEVGMESAIEEELRNYRLRISEVGRKNKFYAVRVMMRDLPSLSTTILVHVEIARSEGRFSIMSDFGLTVGHPICSN